MQVSDNPCHRVDSRPHAAMLSKFLMPLEHDVASTVAQDVEARPDWPDIALAAVLTAVLFGVPAALLLFP
jgi:hypothetical protein